MPGWQPLERGLAKLAEETGASKVVQEAAETAWAKVAPEISNIRQGPKPILAEDIVAKSVERGKAPAGVYDWFLSDIRGLRDPRTVTVQNAYVSNKRAWLKTEFDGEFRRSAVYLDGKRVGQFDKMGPVDRKEFPLTIRAANLVLSNGQRVSVAERDLPVITRWVSNGSRNFPEKSLALNSEIKRITPFSWATFDQMLEIKPGAKMITEFPFQRVGKELRNGENSFPLYRTNAYTKSSDTEHVSKETWNRFIHSLEGQYKSDGTLPPWVNVKDRFPAFPPNADILSKLTGGRVHPVSGQADYPFQWFDKKLTNGNVSFPQVRPEGGEWRKLPIPAVPERFWTPYLKSLEGQYVDEILPNLRGFLFRSRTPLIAREPKLSPFQGEVKAVLEKTKEGELWAGNESTLQGVKLGNGVMFKQPVVGGKNIFVLEQADRAVYLFKTEAEAERIATGQVLRTDARKAGNRFVVHAGDWKTKLEDQIRTLAEELRLQGAMKVS